MKIYTDTSEGSTVIQNSFIDRYMPQANGEFVKVYLYLLRCADSGRELSLSSIADVFEHTEKDVRRALIYWERQKLLRTKVAADGTVESVTFTDPGCYASPANVPEGEPEELDLYSDGMAPYPEQSSIPKERMKRGDAKGAAGETADEAAKEAVKDAVRETNRKDRTKNAEEAAEMGIKDKEKEAEEDGNPVLSQLSASAQEELRELYFVAEQYLRRPLSSTEQNDFVYYYHTLGLSADLIEYLLEYCITRGTTSRHYMRKVALGWAESGITTVQEAKRESSLYNRNFFSVMKAFGLKGRNPAPPEQEMINRWLNEYGFSMDLILEACRRTINQIHEPNFQYADRILQQWLSDNVHTMDDIRAADEKWEQGQNVKKNAAKNAGKNTQGRTRSASAGRFNNFTQREYNYDNLEKQLFGQS